MRENFHNFPKCCQQMVKINKKKNHWSTLLWLHIIMAFNGGKDITFLGPLHFLGVSKLYFLTMPKLEYVQ